MEIINTSTLLAIVGCITVLTNLIVQVLKKSLWDKLPTNALALIVAEVLTLAGGAAYAQINAMTITWYMVAAAVVAGFMSAYAAMFGFDKLQEAIKSGKSS